MRGLGTKDRGAALITILLFMALTLILIMSMLTVAGNEVVISGLQRDSDRALELAQAGIQEAIRRMEEGRPYLQGFTSSLSPFVTVSVVRRYVGTNSAYQEIRADATVGRALRRLSSLVLQRMITMPPNITFAASVIEQGSAQIACGDAYARTFIQYKDYPSNACPDGPQPPTITYAGWRISKADPGAIGPCDTNVQCASLGQSLWYPATRLAEPAPTALGTQLVGLTRACSGGGLPPDVLPPGSTAADGNDISGWPVYGFDTDDPGTGALAVTARLPCGLPYKWESMQFADEGGNTVTRVFKHIVFEQWFDNYWTFDESQMTYAKKSSLISYPRFGAVPPFPSIDTLESNYDRTVTGGGTVNSGDFGCKWPEMSGDPNCAIAPANADRAIAVLMDNGDYTINGNLKGHGTIVVDGNLIVNGTFEFWGTIVVKGTLTLGAGNAIVHGGAVANNTLKISGNITVDGGGTITNVPVGRSVLIGKGWWER